MSETSPGELRTLLSRIPAMIGYWDRELRNRLANDAYLEFFGVTPEAMRGLHIRDLLGPALYQQNLPYMQRALAGEEQDIVDGEVRGFSVLVTDLTARHEAEVALADAERRFRTLFESAPIVEPDGQIRDLNPAAETVLGRSRGELLGLTVADITHQEDEEATSARLAQLSGGEIASFRAQKRFRGRTIWAQVDATVLRTGEETLIVEQIQDVSERRRHERRMAQFRALLESAPDAVVNVSADVRILLVNAGTEALFGYTRDVLVGQPVDLLVPERFRGRDAGHRTDASAAAGKIVARVMNLGNRNRNHEAIRAAGRADLCARRGAARAGARRQDTF